LQIGELTVNEEELKLFFKKIINTQRDFFNDYDFPFYLITLIAFDPFHNQKIMLGTHVKNGFVMYLPDNIDPLLLSKQLFAHEHLHNWLGGKLKPPDDYLELTWFFEGFTDYLASITAFKADCIQLDEYIEDLNEAIKKIYTSPFSSINNPTLKLLFWQSPQVEIIPYIRGRLLALIWDYKINKLSQGKYTIAEPIKDLLHHAKSHSNIINENIIIDCFSPYLKYNAEIDIQNFVQNGNLINKLPKHIIPDYFLNYASEEVEYFNFDIQPITSLTTHSITKNNNNHDTLVLLNDTEHIDKVTLYRNDSNGPCIANIKVDTKENHRNITLRSYHKVVAIPYYKKAIYPKNHPWQNVVGINAISP
jgi:predicted metalloprotease with PDZ domain